MSESKEFNMKKVKTLDFKVIHIRGREVEQIATSFGKIKGVARKLLRKLGIHNDDGNWNIQM